MDGLSTKNSTTANSKTFFEEASLNQRPLLRNPGNGEIMCCKDTVKSEKDDDPLIRIKQNFEKHLCRLERYKKAKSFCSLEDESSNGSSSTSFTTFHHNPQASLDIMQKTLSTGSSSSSIGGRQPKSNDSTSTTAVSINVKSQMPSTNNDDKNSLPSFCSCSTPTLIEGGDSVIVDNSNEHSMFMVGSATTTIHHGHGDQCHHQATTSTAPYSSSSTPSTFFPSHLSRNCQNPAYNRPLIGQEQFEQLRNTMISLVEKDVQLLQKLLNLSETLREIRERRQRNELINNDNNNNNNSNNNEICMRSDIDSETSSCFSLELDPNNKWRRRESMETSNGCEKKIYEDDALSDQEKRDEFRPLLPHRSLPLIDKNIQSSTITNLYVESNEERSEEDEEMDNCDGDGKPRRQYFSRKNSVLRIPIPPRASNRMLGKKMKMLPLKPSELVRHCTSRQSNIIRSDSRNNIANIPQNDQFSSSSSSSEQNDSQKFDNNKNKNGIKICSDNTNNSKNSDTSDQITINSIAPTQTPTTKAITKTAVAFHTNRHQQTNDNHHQKQQQQQQLKLQQHQEDSGHSSAESDSSSPQRQTSPPFSLILDDCLTESVSASLKRVTNTSENGAGIRREKQQQQNEQMHQTHNQCLPSSSAPSELREDLLSSISSATNPPSTVMMMIEAQHQKSDSACESIASSSSSQFRTPSSRYSTFSSTSSSTDSAFESISSPSAVSSKTTTTTINGLSSQQKHNIGKTLRREEGILEKSIATKIAIDDTSEPHFLLDMPFLHV